MNTEDPECVVLRIETKDIVVIYEALLECFPTIDIEVDEDTSDVPWPFEQTKFSTDNQKEAIKKLNDREKNIMEMRFGFISGKEKTQKEVADELGISQSYISRLEKKIINKMKKDIMSKTG